MTAANIQDEIKRRIARAEQRAYEANYMTAWSSAKRGEGEARALRALLADLEAGEVE